MIATPNIDTPAPIESYRKSLLALTGIDCEQADETGEAMAKSLMHPQEILAIMFLKTMRSMLRGLNRTLNLAKADNVYSVWSEASALRAFTSRSDQTRPNQLARRPPQLPVADLDIVRPKACAAHTIDHLPTNVRCD